MAGGVRLLPRIVATAVLCGSGAATAVPPIVPPADATPPVRLDTAPKVERQTLQSLLDHEAWPRRAIAALRLERFECDESRTMLVELLDDPAWQVRAYAVRTLGRRRVPAEPDWFAEEQEPRVLRAALRHRYALDVERLGRGTRVLARSNGLEQKMLAVELGAASGDETLTEMARETTRTIILRMSRIDAGALSPRLAVMTGQPDLRRHHRWQQWLRKTGRGFEVLPAFAIPEGDQPLALPLIAQLPADRLSALEQYIEQLGSRKLDLAICLDCTSSMSGELAAAQGGIDDMMIFIGDVVGELRVAIVAYRDARDEFETKGWPFTSNIEKARRQLWQLSAEGGGDSPEAVFPAMKMVYTQLKWMPEHTKVLVLIGDAPPHVGLGTRCADMARRAFEEAQLTTHVVQADRDEDVKHFPEIAEAGGGRCVNLADDDALIAEITGLTLGDAFQDEFGEFFRIYLELCR